MPTFEYKAMTGQGQMIKNKIDYDGSMATLKNQLIAQGLKIVSIKEVKFSLEKLLGKGHKGRMNKKAAIGLTEAVSTQNQMLSESVASVSKAKPKKSWQEMLKGDIDMSEILKKLGPLTALFTRVKVEQVVSFTEMFLLLKRSNFTNIRAINTLYQNTENPALKNILGDMIDGMETGGYIYSTMEYYPKVFPEIYTNLIKVGETTGSLVNSLEQALKYLQDSTRVKKAVKKALVGPLLQSVGLLIGGVLCIIFGLPVMQDMYASYGLTDQIPEATISAANVIYWCGDHWYIVIAVIVAIVIGCKVWVSTPGGSYAWAKFKIKCPVFGQLILRLQIQKFFVAVNINLKNNARLQDAISDCKDVVTNDVLRAAIEAAEANLIVGDSWIEPFENMKEFPPMLQEMLRIGMETNMAEMIDNILRFIDEDIRITIERITKVLPQVSMGFMGIILVGFVIIILKPIMEVYMGSFLFEANGI